MTEKFKKIIFDKLYKDLEHVEIIPYDKSIWFIDREKRFWILELTLDGKLWWRTDFFKNFFSLFSMAPREFQILLCEWVEQVLNRKVETSHRWCKKRKNKVEQVLNRKVETSDDFDLCSSYKLDKILGYKVKKSDNLNLTQSLLLDELLKYEELRPIRLSFANQTLVDMALSINKL
jgi:hypothetical protein